MLHVFFGETLVTLAAVLERRGDQKEIGRFGDLMRGFDSATSKPSMGQALQISERFLESEEQYPSITLAGGRPYNGLIMPWHTFAAFVRRPLWDVEWRVKEGMEIDPFPHKETKYYRLRSDQAAVMAACGMVTRGQARRERRNMDELVARFKAKQPLSRRERRAVLGETRPLRRGRVPSPPTPAPAA